MAHSTSPKKSLKKTLQKKKASAKQSGSGKEYRAFCVSVALSLPGVSFVQPGSQSGLSPLGKIAAKAWLDLGEQGRLRVDAMVFRDRELEGLLFLPGSTDAETKLGLAMRLLKARISQAADKAEIASATRTALWKKAYLSQSLATPREIAGVRRRLRLESGSLRNKA